MASSRLERSIEDSHFHSYSPVGNKLDPLQQEDSVIQGSTHPLKSRARLLSGREAEENPGYLSRFGNAVDRYMVLPVRIYFGDLFERVGDGVSAKLSDLRQGQWGLREYEATIKSAENEIARANGQPLPHPELQELRATNTWFCRFDGFLPTVWPKDQRVYAMYDTNLSMWPIRAIPESFQRAYKWTTEGTGVGFGRDGFLYKLLWSSDGPLSAANPDSDNIRAVYAELPRIMESEIQKRYHAFEKSVLRLERRILSHLVHLLGDDDLGSRINTAFQAVEAVLKKDIYDSKKTFTKSQIRQVEKKLEALGVELKSLLDLAGHGYEDFSHLWNSIKQDLANGSRTTRKKIFQQVRELKSGVIFKLWSELANESDTTQLRNQHYCEKLFDKSRTAAFDLDSCNFRAHNTEFAKVKRAWNDTLLNGAYPLRGNKRYRVNDIGTLEVNFRDILEKGETYYATFNEHSALGQDSRHRGHVNSPELSYLKLSGTLEGLQDLLF